MNNMLDNLSGRDRKILLAALPVVAVLVILLLWRAAGDDRDAGQAQTGGDATQAELAMALEDLAWLQTQADAVARLRTGCGGGSWSQAAPRRLAGVHQVSVEPAGGRDRELRFAVSADNGNYVIAWLQALECLGAAVTELSLDTVSAEGAVEGRVVLRAPVT